MSVRSNFTIQNKSYVISYISLLELQIELIRLIVINFHRTRLIRLNLVLLRHVLRRLSRAFSITRTLLIMTPRNNTSSSGRRDNSTSSMTWNRRTQIKCLRLTMMMITLHYYRKLLRLSSRSKIFVNGRQLIRNGNVVNTPRRLTRLVTLLGRSNNIFNYHNRTPYLYRNFLNNENVILHNVVINHSNMDNDILPRYFKEVNTRRKIRYYIITNGVMRTGRRIRNYINCMNVII